MNHRTQEEGIRSQYEAHYPREKRLFVTQRSVEILAFHHFSGAILQFTLRKGFWDTIRTSSVVRLNNSINPIGCIATDSHQINLGKLGFSFSRTELLSTPLTRLVNKAESAVHAKIYTHKAWSLSSCRHANESE